MASERETDDLGDVPLQSTITCPHCGHAEVETMATGACWWSYTCKSCGTQLRPRHGDCCVFCSYGSVPCPSVQRDRSLRA